MKHIEPQHDLTGPRSWLSVFWAHGGIMVVVAGGLCVAMTLFSINSYQSAKQFDVSGIAITALAVDREIRVDSDGHEDFYVTYRYEVDKQVYERARRVSETQYSAAPPQTSLTIRYLPHRPERFETYFGEARDDAFGAQLFAGFTGILGLWGLWVFGKKANRAILTRRYGFRATATVTRVVDGRAKNGRRATHAYLRWRTSDGVEGKTMKWPSADLAAFSEGDKITVYVRKGFGMWERDVGHHETTPSNVPHVEDQE